MDYVKKSQTPEATIQSLSRKSPNPVPFQGKSAGLLYGKMKTRKPKPSVYSLLSKCTMLCLCIIYRKINKIITQFEFVCVLLP